MEAVMDHIVLNCRDIDRQLAFYCEVVGLAPERVTEFREGKVLFPSVRLNENTLIDLAPPTVWSGDRAGAPNLNHFCMSVEVSEWSDLLQRIDRAGVKMDAGPMRLWGAHGNATSYYLKDPEGNQLEIRCYGAD